MIGTYPALRLNIEDYPALKEYLLSFMPRIEQSGKQGCRKRTSNKWFETQDNIAYWSDFDRQKIVYPCIMSKEPCFAYDEKATFFAPAPANIITGDLNDVKFLCSCLNSTLIYFALRKFYMGGGIEGELKTNNLEKLPIPKIPNTKKQNFINLVDKILDAKQTNSPTKDFEKQIDKLVYDLYGLNKDEIKIVENH